VTRASDDRLRVGVLASGRGTNLQALLDACARPDFPARVVVVLSDRERAQALERARTAGVEAAFVNLKDFADREAFDLALVRLLEARRVGLVCHAGFMRILSPAYVRAFAGRALNVHPSLLPAFPGLSAQRQALDWGVKVAGATVHFVDEGVDTGPIVLQASVPVHPDDTEESLSARILAEEHRLYPEAVRLFAEGRLRIAGRRVVVRAAGRPGAGPPASEASL
jgi:phosphoribosylglycinamide formyltransferase-1